MASDFGTTWGYPLAAAAAAILVPAAVRYAIESGLLWAPDIKNATPPMRDVVVMYRLGSGPYHLSGGVFKELHRLVPHLKPIGFYYDDPTKVPAAKLRWGVGVIAAEGSEEVDPKIEGKLEAVGFRQCRLPCADRAVQTEWPYKSWLAMYLLYTRVYRAIVKFMEECSLKEDAFPCLELYNRSTVTVMFMLDHQQDFYLPGVEFHRA